MEIDHTIHLALNSKASSYDVSVGNDLLSDAGIWAKHCLRSSTKRVAVISNEKVFSLYGERVLASLAAQDFLVHKWLMEDGEENKNFESLQLLLSFLSENGFTRSDSIVALGGGVVGDLAGFASAVYMRGLQFLQIPTTLLSMIDAAVGGKTAINLASGKNLVGAFHQPRGVLVDVGTLKTLDERELAAGFFEGIKHGAIGGEDILRKIGEFLNDFPVSRFEKSFKETDFVLRMEKIIASHVEFKARIVMEDEREETQRRDSHSRKILNFGHTVGHALENATDYKYFKHGEAVGYGILAAAELSKKLELIDDISLELLNDVVASVGSLPEARHIDQQRIIDAFTFDKKMDGASRDWILLEGIGKPIVVRDSEIPAAFVEDTLQKVLSRWSPDPSLRILENKK